MDSPLGEAPDAFVLPITLGRKGGTAENFPEFLRRDSEPAGQQRLLQQTCAIFYPQSHRGERVFKYALSKTGEGGKRRVPARTCPTRIPDASDQGFWESAAVETVVKIAKTGAAETGARR